MQQMESTLCLRLSSGPPTAAAAGHWQLPVAVARRLGVQRRSAATACKDYGCGVQASKQACNGSKQMVRARRRMPGQTSAVHSTQGVSRTYESDSDSEGYMTTGTATTTRGAHVLEALSMQLVDSSSGAGSSGSDGSQCSALHSRHHASAVLGAALPVQLPRRASGRLEGSVSAILKACRMVGRRSWLGYGAAVPLPLSSRQHWQRTWEARVRARCAHFPTTRIQPSE